MNISQKTVVTGVAGGVFIMALLVAGLALALPAPQVNSILDRLVFALQLNAFAALPFIATVVAIANSRFATEAINPLANRETLAQRTDGRVCDNTLQQTFLFMVGSLALSTVLPADKLSVLTALTIVFVLARIVFWIGYRINPLYRAPGFAATAWLNIGTLVSALALAIF